MLGEIEMRWLADFTIDANTTALLPMTSGGRPVKLQFRYQEEDWGGQSEEPDYKWSEWTDVEIEL